MTGAALLRDRAGEFARVALANIAREYPNDLRHTMTGPRDLPRPRDLHPAFYGSLDWHSCVEMHWVLVRLLRTVPDQVPRAEIRAALDEHLAAEPLAAEAAYLADPAHAIFQRPYGWGWALTLVHEASSWPDPDARRWAANLAGLGDVLTASYLEWLPKATYPVRYGMHSNSAFGLSLALPFAAWRAQAGDGALLAAVTEAAVRWFGEDTDYPGGWEPSGIDFLSPALVEAELMARVLDPVRFAAWLKRFLPGIAARQPAALFTPAEVSDPTDGHIAHLHGLNLSRAWCWRRLAASLPDDDPRAAPMIDAARRHAEVALPHVTGSHYMVEHWLACYAVLYLS
ncbi:MAG: DUF2891 domain-containing protein [Egibacteraceae bacterium]